MTETECLACTDLVPLLEALPDKARERKLRLFACACVRSVWYLLEDERSRQAVEVAERFADGQAAEAVAVGLAALEASRRSALDVSQALAASAATATLRAFVTGDEVASGYLAAASGVLAKVLLPAVSVPMRSAWRRAASEPPEDRGHTCDLTYM